MVPSDLINTGATVDDDTPTNARIMLATSCCYLVVQLVAFKCAQFLYGSTYLSRRYIYADMSPAAKTVEKWCALVGMIFCFGALILYCVYQVCLPALRQLIAFLIPAL